MNKAELELLHREVDGENSADDSRRAQALLSESGEARELFEQLSLVDRHLREAEMVEPPAWLKRSVLDVLPARRSEARSARSVGVTDFFRGLLETLQARPALAYAYTFAAGLAVGLALFAVALQDSAPADEDLYGTFVGEEPQEQLAEVGTTAIRLPGLDGEVELLASRELLVVDLALEATEPADVRLVPEAPLALRGFTRKAGRGEIDIDRDDLVLGVQGSEAYALLFDRPETGPSEVRLEIRRDGRLIYEERLRSD